MSDDAQQDQAAFSADFPNRRVIYADVEELINKGFLKCMVDIGETQVCLRSVFTDDHDLLLSRIGVNGTVRMWKEWAVSATTYLIGGQVVLGELNAACYVRDVLREVPASCLDVLYTQYTGLFNRLTEALDRVEAFCYEDYSRGLWRTHGRTFPKVLGLSNCTNAVQRMWVAYNLAEDDRLHRQDQWNNARFMASATNPKGVRSIAEKDGQNQNMEMARRRSVIGNLYLRTTGRAHLQRGPRHSVTPEELIEEMAKYRRGERDAHDLIVEAEKERIRQRYAEDEAQHEARMAALDAEGLRNHPLMGGTDDTMIGLTAEQVDELRRQGGKTTTPGRRVISDLGARDRLFERYIKDEIRVGVLGTNGRATVAPTPDNSVP